MTPYFDSHRLTIYHGNCLDILPELESVDLIVTDPAYKGISGGNKRHDNSPSGILKINDGKIFQHNDIKTSQYASLFYNVLKAPAHCYVMINNLNLETALRDFRLAGFGFHNLLTWDKCSPTPNRWYMKSSEHILFFYKGAAFPINNPSTKTILKHPPVVKGGKIHPTEKPETLNRELICNSSQPEQTILDPFMGSGSVLEAAWKCGRRAIGIDLDEQYCEQATRRLEKLISGCWQLDLMEVA